MRTAVKITDKAKNSTFEKCKIYGGLEDSGKNSKFLKTSIGFKQKIKENPIKSIIVGVIVATIAGLIQYYFFGIKF